MGKEKITKKLEQLEKALKTLHLAMVKHGKTSEAHEDYVFFRDSLIKRFEYCTDMFWKTIREFIAECHGIELPVSSKKVIQQALDVYLINEDQYEQLLASVNDRNMTAHAYQEDVAAQIADHVAGYYQLMSQLLQKMKQELQIF